MARWFSMVLWMVMAVGLMGSRCGGAEAVSLEALREDVAPPFDYGLYSDERGNLEGETSAVLLAHRGEHLERVYAEAQEGNARARVLYGQLEQTTGAAGEGLADRALSLGCTALPTCTVKWSELGTLIPATGPGGVRLRQLLAHGFEQEARRKHVENAVITAALNALVVVGAAATVEGAVASGEVKAGAGEARVLGREATAGAESALGEVEGRLAQQEAEALEARFEQAEALEDEGRQPGRLEELEKLRPAVDKPPRSVGADTQAWGEYVAYWERRYEELSGLKQRPVSLEPAKPPLEWSSYKSFRGRFQRAMEFQREVTGTLRQQARLGEGERTWLKGMEKPRVDENVGLGHEPAGTLTYVDQFVVDEASVRSGSTPVVHSFSTKQRDFNAMSKGQVQDCVAADVKEAMRKYGGVVEVRRPGHPLFGRRISVSNVHLVYDGQPISAKIQELLKQEVGGSHVELHFHIK